MREDNPIDLVCCLYKLKTLHHVIREKCSTPYTAILLLLIVHDNKVMKQFTIGLEARQVSI